MLLEHYRSGSKKESTLDDEPETVFANREPDALSLLETKDRQRIVRQILSELCERDRSLLRSVLLEERDKDEVCAELGISREYLRVLVHRAKQSFKVFLCEPLRREEALVTRCGNADTMIRFLSPSTIELRP